MSTRRVPPPAPGPAARLATVRPLGRRCRRLPLHVLGVGRGRRREDDSEDGPAPGPRAVGDGAPVRLDHRADDREPQPGTALAARPRTVGSVETLEDPVGLLGRYPGARVGDLEHDLTV